MLLVHCVDRYSSLEQVVEQALHAVASGCPVCVLNVPISHILQSLFEVRPTWSDHRPATHARHPRSLPAVPDS